MSKLCAICEKKPVDELFKPFCSKRCADLDLHRWLSGRYVVPGKAAVEADEDFDPE
ncbi:MAG: hypothetical protein JWP35_2435 [Caulobacter sp.]|nr:hypothetical protein [Caulobacter sp.]